MESNIIQIVDRDNVHSRRVSGLWEDPEPNLTCTTESDQETATAVIKCRFSGSVKQNLTRGCKLALDRS